MYEFEKFKVLKAAAKALFCNGVKCLLGLIHRPVLMTTPICIYGNVCFWQMQVDGKKFWDARL